jgi:hypothetical protein
MRGAQNIMSVAAYAKSRGADEETVYHQIRTGRIRMLGRGRIDADQADAAWGRVRISRVRVQQDDAGARSAESRIVAGFAKLRFAKDEFEMRRERYVGRAEASAHLAEEIAAFERLWTEMPRRRATELAARLGLELAVAERLLQEFARLVAGEFALSPSSDVQAA